MGNGGHKLKAEEEPTKVSPVPVKQEDVYAKQKRLISELVKTMSSQKIRESDTRDPGVISALSNVKRCVEAFKENGGWGALMYWYTVDTNFKTEWDKYFTHNTVYKVPIPGNKFRVVTQTSEEKIKEIASIKMSGADGCYEVVYALCDFFADSSVRQKLVNDWVDWYDEHKVYDLYPSFVWNTTYFFADSLIVSPVKSAWYATFGESEQEEEVLKNPSPLNMVGYSKGVSFRNFDLLVTGLFLVKPVVAGLDSLGKVLWKIEVASVEQRIESTVERIAKMAEKRGVSGQELEAVKTYTRALLEKQFESGGKLAKGTRALRTSVATELYPEGKFVRSLLPFKTDMSIENLIRTVKSGSDQLVDQLAKQVGIPADELRAIANAYAPFFEPVKIAENAAAKTATKVAAEGAAKKTAAETTESAAKTAEEAATKTARVAEAVEDATAQVRTTLQMLETEKGKLLEKIKSPKDVDELRQAHADLKEIEGLIEKETKKLSVTDRVVDKAKKIGESRPAQATSKVAELLEMKNFYESLRIVKKTKAWKELTETIESCKKQIAEIKAGAAARELTEAEAKEIDGLTISVLTMESKKLGLLPKVGYAADYAVAGIPEDVLRISWWLMSLPEREFAKAFKYVVNAVPGFADAFWPISAYYALAAVGYAPTAMGQEGIPTQRLQKDLEAAGMAFKFTVSDSRIELSGEPFEPAVYVSFEVGFYLNEEGKDELVNYTLEKGFEKGGIKIELTIEDLHLEGSDEDKRIKIKEKLEDKIRSKTGYVIDDSAFLDSITERILEKQKKAEKEGFKPAEPPAGVGGGPSQETKMGEPQKKNKLEQTVAMKEVAEAKEQVLTDLNIIDKDSRASVGLLLDRLIETQTSGANSGLAVIYPNVFTPFKVFWENFGEHLTVSEENIPAIVQLFRYYKSNTSTKEELNKNAVVLGHIVSEKQGDVTKVTGGDSSKLNEKVFIPFVKFMKERTFEEQDSVVFIADEFFISLGGKGRVPIQTQKLEEPTGFMTREDVEPIVSSARETLGNLKVAEAKAILTDAEWQLQYGYYEEAFTLASDVPNIIDRRKEEALGAIVGAKAELGAAKTKRIFSEDLSLDNADQLLEKGDYDGALEEAQKVSEKITESPLKEERLKILFGKHDRDRISTLTTLNIKYSFEGLSATKLDAFANAMDYVYTHYRELDYASGQKAVLAFFTYLTGDDSSGKNNDGFLFGISGGEKEYRAYYDQFYKLVKKK